MEDIRINDQTVGNLIKYLQTFPEDAKVVFWDDYKIWHCQIAINFEHQKEINTVQLLKGMLIKTEGGQ